MTRGYINYIIFVIKKYFIRFKDKNKVNNAEKISVYKLKKRNYNLYRIYIVINL